MPDPNGPRTDSLDPEKTRAKLEAAERQSLSDREVSADSIERWECPVHGWDVGDAHRPAGSDVLSCGRYMGSPKRCQAPLALVKYVPAASLWCPSCEEPMQAPPEEREKLYELYNLLTAPAGSGGAEGQVQDALIYLREPVAETDSLVAERDRLRAENERLKAQNQLYEASLLWIAHQTGASTIDDAVRAMNDAYDSATEALGSRPSSDEIKPTEDNHAD